MLVKEAISKINYALRGIDDDAPVVGSDEYTYWLSTLNRKKDELYQDVSQNWSNTYEVRSIGTVSASAEPSFDLDDDFLAPSDLVYIIDSDGQRREYTIIHPDERSTNRREVFIAGRNPKVLYFTGEIVAGDSVVGGTLYAPGYYLPEDMVSENDELPFPDSNWGVMATAHEIAFNDIIYETKAPDLNDKANALWKQMTNMNRRGTYNNPRRAPTNVYRIRSPQRSR